jgi:arsenite methyltransferase
LGVDISEPMPARAVRAEAGPQVGFLRADAQRLPLRDQTVDAVVSIAVLQLIPEPAAALAEIARVLRPGGRVALMVPTAGRAAQLWKKLPNIGAYVFGEDELGDILEDRGFVSVRTKNVGTLQWVRAKRG